MILCPEPSGWNDAMDQAWRAAVNQAISPTVLMECVVLLEHYINKAWLQVSVVNVSVDENMKCYSILITGGKMKFVVEKWRES